MFLYKEIEIVCLWTTLKTLKDPFAFLVATARFLQGLGSGLGGLATSTGGEASSLSNAVRVGPRFLASLVAIAGCGAGFAARGGQLIDASFVEVPKQRNNKDENEQIKAGDIPEEWKEDEAKLRQKDVEARWTKKNNQSYFGYKNHINVDRNCKLIRRYEVTDASMHDSQEFCGLVDPTNTNADVFADSAYRSEEIEAELKEAGYRSKIHHRAYRNTPLTKLQEKSNRTRSKVRARVEHVFGYQANSMKAGLIQTIGIARANAKIGMTNLVYNMQRLIQLRHIYRIAPPVMA